jgi:hypothetical protein
MKKLLPISIIIVGIVFVAGCIGGEKTSQSNSQSPNSILKTDDIPGFILWQNSYIAVNKSSPVNFNFNSSNFSRAYYEVDGMEYYKDELKTNMKKIGEKSIWTGKSGQTVDYLLIKYDSNSGFKDWFDYLQKAPKSKYVVDVGTANIGDFSLYSKGYSGGMETTSIYFAYKNYYAQIGFTGKNGTTYDEATRIADIIKSRLE